MFERFARWSSHAAGRGEAFAIMLALTIVWAASGPLFGYSDTWQLIINTATTIITGLMVFLLQSSQNRDTAAIQAKLDELLRASERASNALIGIERQ